MSDARVYLRLEYNCNRLLSIPETLILPRLNVLVLEWLDWGALWIQRRYSYVSYP